MKYSIGFSNLIYEYFVTRFHFRYYQYGESLPTIDSLAKQFGVSTLTIKNALKRLQKEGYISMKNGQSASVIFQPSDEALEKYAAEFFRKRRNAIIDTCKSSNIIVTPMFIKGLKNLGEMDFIYLEHLADRLFPEDILRFYSYVLQKAENPLALNLFWESTVFYGLPYLFHSNGKSTINQEKWKKRLKALISNARSGNFNVIANISPSFEHEIASRISELLCSKETPLNEEGKISFKWRVYRDHPQICCGFAVRIIHDIYMGDFKGMEFLPSYEKMAKKYGVSVSTTRRTVSLLGKLGAVKPINGKGVKILMLRDFDNEVQADLSTPTIRRNMAYFYQSSELIAVSCQQVIHFVLNSVSKEERAQLLNFLEETTSHNRYVITLQCIYSFIAEHSPLQSLSEIYTKLYGLNLWGYPLKSFRKRMPKLDKYLAEFSNSVITYLREDDIDKFCAAVGELVQNEYIIAEDILLNNGFSREELCESPSFSFFQSKKF